MATIKKASIKAVEYCCQVTGQKIPKTATWESLADVLLDGFQVSVETALKGTTVIKLFRESPEGKDLLIETWTVPNKDCFDTKYNDYDWAYIYKLTSEYVLKNRRRIMAGKAGKKSTKELAKEVKAATPASAPKMSAAEELSRLKEAIRTAKGTEKQRLVAEYNKKSRAAETSKLTGEALLRRLDNDRYNIKERIKTRQAKGVPESELGALRAELAVAEERYARAKAAAKAAKKAAKKASALI